MDTNPSLRLAVQNAKGANMPKDTIERAIKKGTGGEGANLVEITFEGYASNGIAVFVEATTDNNNRIVASVRSIFNKYNGNLGTNGSLGFLFERKGIFTLKKETIQQLTLLGLLILLILETRITSSRLMSLSISILITLRSGLVPRVCL